MYSGCTDYIRTAINFRYRMFPYLYSLMERAHESGLPIMEAMCSAFQNDPNCYEEGVDFMFGDSLLVANVVEKGAETRKIYLPEGHVFYDFYTRTPYHGGQTIEIPVDLGSIPLFVKGGAIIPMIALGIPGDATTVLLMSAMTIHGLQAGPMFIKTNPQLANLIFATVLVSAILIFATELLTKRWFPMLLKAPYHYLYSAILMICFLGAYSASTSMFSVYLVLVFGAVGILMEFFKMPSTPLMLAFILGSKIESYFRMGCSYARGDMTSFVTRPISLIFILIAVYSIVGPIITKILKKRKAVAAN